MAKTKEQIREYNREYQRKRRRGEVVDRPYISTSGIENENQLDSVIREMAELQAGIEHEKALCQYRVSLIQKYLDETIEPWLARQAALRTRLLKFIKKLPGKSFLGRYRFGVVSYSRGKLKIELNADLAKQKMGKP